MNANSWTSRIAVNRLNEKMTLKFVDDCRFPDHPLVVLATHVLFFDRAIAWSQPVWAVGHDGELVDVQNELMQAAGLLNHLVALKAKKDSAIVSFEVRQNTGCRDLLAETNRRMARCLMYAPEPKPTWLQQNGVKMIPLLVALPVAASGGLAIPTLEWIGQWPMIFKVPAMLVFAYGAPMAGLLPLVGVLKVLQFVFGDAVFRPQLSRLSMLPRAKEKPSLPNRLLEVWNRVFESMVFIKPLRKLYMIGGMLSPIWGGVLAWKVAGALGQGLEPWLGHAVFGSVFSIGIWATLLVGMHASWIALADGLGEFEFLGKLRLWGQMMDKIDAIKARYEKFKNRNVVDAHRVGPDRYSADPEDGPRRLK